MTLRFLTTILLILAGFAVNAQAPVAEFSASQVSGCAPFAVRFTDQSTGSPKFWNWDFGNGQISNIQNPTVTYSVPGTYSVTLVVRNSNGTNGITKTALINVFASPQARFTADRTNACVPLVINFTDRSTDPSGTITSYLWNFGDGTTSTERNPSHSYTQPGWYTVDLTITSSSGCTSRASAFRYVRIFNGVQADFIVPNVNTCQPPFNLKFDNQTSGPGTLSYAWDLGNGSTSTVEDPLATYNAAGNYQVRLTATSSFGCSSIVTKVVAPSAFNSSFSSPDSVCIGGSAQLTNTSTVRPLSYYWKINGVIDSSAAPTVRFNTAGTYVLKLIQNFGNCTDSVSRNLVVVPKPSVQFTSNTTTGCKNPTTINFTDQTPNSVSWLWNFGDGNTSTEKNPQHIYNNYGKYTVKLQVTDAFGCTDTLSKIEYISIEEPVLSISNAPTGGCAPFTFRGNTNIVSNEPIANYLWDFGTGATSTASNPTYIYTDSGSYNLSLKITTISGCTDSVNLVRGIRVGKSIPVNFEVSNPDACASTGISFTDLSVGADAWNWNFGDGGSSTQRNPTYTYTDTGTFNVTLVAFNNGCGTAIEKFNVVSVRPPVAGFEHITDCTTGTMVMFRNTSKVDNSKTVKYLWNFGDPSNTIDSVINPSFQYPGPGTYNVTLTTTNDTCSSTVVLPVIITNIKADFTSAQQTYCSNFRFTFEAINSNPDNIVRYQWKFGNAPYVTGQRTIGHRITIPGKYDVSLIITDINGCSDTLYRPAYLTITGPIARFNINKMEECSGAPVTFSDVSTSASPIVNWRWNFGDGTVQDFTSAPFTHTYADTGTYNIVLTVRDANGCESQFGRNNAIHVSQAQAGFYSDTTTICPGLPVNFTDSSKGPALQYTWDFGDGQTSTDSNPSHIFPSDNGRSYSVKLSVTNQFGCVDSVVKTNYITIQKPIAGFSTKDTITLCPPLESNFIYTGSGEEAVYWDMGDGTDYYYGDTVRHFFNTFGTFTVKQYSVGFGGCLDSASQVVRVINPNTTGINYSPTDACNRLLVDFNITPPPATRFTLFFGDGKSDTTQTTSLQHFYGAPAFYFPQVQLRDPVGCLVNVSGSRPIRVIGAIPLFGVDRKEFCDSGTVYFTNYTIGNDPITSYQWDFGDGSTSSDKDEIHLFRQPGTYVVSLTVNTRSGCSDIAYDTIVIHPTPVATILSRDTICTGTSVSFLGSLVNGDTEIVNWNWDFGNGQTSTIRNPATVYNTPGTYTITLNTSVAFGCSSRNTKQIVIEPAPTITFDGDVVTAPGRQVTLPVTYTGDIVKYEWTPPGTLTCNDCPVPNARPVTNTTYTVTVTDVLGCTVSNQVNVLVVCQGKNMFLPTTFSPNRDGKNDTFYPRGTGLFSIKSFRIFNRWGEMVFEKTNFAPNNSSMGWDGTYKGKSLVSDVYIYSVDIVCTNGETFSDKGNVMLLR